MLKEKDRRLWNDYKLRNELQTINFFFQTIDTYFNSLKDIPLRFCVSRIFLVPNDGRFTQHLSNSNSHHWIRNAPVF